jgi:hypothetical protein
MCRLLAKEDKSRSQKPMWIETITSTRMIREKNSNIPPPSPLPLMLQKSIASQAFKGKTNSDVKCFYKIKYLDTEVTENVLNTKNLNIL